MSLILLAHPVLAEAFDKPFISPTSWGGTGLIEIPTARIIDDGEFRAGSSYAYPFLSYHASLGFLPGLELNGRITEILNRDVDKPKFEGYGHYKDKALDFKYQVLPETRYFPAVAFGMQDFHGTKLFSSKYLALSRQFYPLDFTVGYGLDRLSGPFAGLEWAVTDRLGFMAEYNPIEYEQDPVDAPAGKAKIPVNFGMRFHVTKWLTVNASLQRDDTLGFMVNMHFPLGKPMRPWKPDPPYIAPVNREPLVQRNPQEVVDEIQKKLIDQGFSNLRVFLKNKELTVEYENFHYLSEVKAVGRILRTIAADTPRDLNRIHAVIKRRNLPTVMVSVKPQQLIDYINGKIGEDEFSRMVEVSTEWEEREGDYPTTSLHKGKWYDYGLDPAIETYLNDPSGFFKYRVGVDLWSRLSLWKGGSIFSRYKIPFDSTVETVNEPISEDPIRSDIVEYLNENPRLQELLVDNVLRIEDKTFGRVSLGYLETQYAGIGGEILHIPGEGRWSLGLEGDWVFKRDPEDPFKLMGSDKYSLLGSLNYQLADLGLVGRAKAGRFLGGDPGVRFQLDRFYDTGASVSFWYSMTDTDDFTGPNRNYRDKGVKFTIPARMFFDHDSRLRYSYGLSPWTRDVGQTVNHYNPLFDFLRDMMPTQIKSHLLEMKQ
ncbi:MAG: YjbH domain-containing protein [Thermodesulfobacteriota bacterium]